MTDRTPDPDVEWLAARLLGDHMHPDPTEPWVSLPESVREVWRPRARTALAILRERYILVPRDGATPEAVARALGWVLAHEHETLYSGLADLTGKPHTRSVVQGPWEPAP